LGLTDQGNWALGRGKTETGIYTYSHRLVLSRAWAAGPRTARDGNMEARRGGMRTGASGGQYNEGHLQNRMNRRGVPRRPGGRAWTQSGSIDEKLELKKKRSVGGNGERYWRCLYSLGSAQQKRTSTEKGGEGIGVRKFQVLRGRGKGGGEALFMSLLQGESKEGKKVSTTTTK